MTRPDPRRGLPADHDPILRTVARAVFYLVLAFALHLFWRGHGAPGGGFIAGLVASSALVLYKIAFGADAANVKPRALLPLGLGVAALTGIAPMLLGAPFLTSAHGHLETAVTGDFEWATAVLFDAGVFLVVVGTTLSIVGVLGDAPAAMDDAVGEGEG